MDHLGTTKLAAAIRDEGRTGSTASAPPLLERVEHILFLEGLIGPSVSVLSHAIETLVSAPAWTELDDAELCDGFADAVRSAGLQFALEADDWDDDHSVKFRETVAACFGVDDQRVARLMRSLVDLAPPGRFGVLVMLRRSASFEYLVREFSEFDGDVSIDDPDTSFRSVIRATFADR